VRSRILTLFCVLSLLSLPYYGPGIAAEEARKDCRLCGMWIDQHMHTRHVLTTKEGAQINFCSFACAVRYLKNHAAEEKLLQVADYLTTQLTDAKSAFYLVGSDAPPVMSYESIIAFASREEAENFQKVHGGRIMSFDEALAPPQVPTKNQGETSLPSGRSWTDRPVDRCDSTGVLRGQYSLFPRQNQCCAFQVAFRG
jgi:copper chaperone NosL